MASSQTYVVRAPAYANPTASATLPVLQIAANAGKIMRVLGWQISNEASTTSTAFVAELVRSTATAPGTLVNTTPVAVGVALNAWDGAIPATLTTGGFLGALTGTQSTWRRVGGNFLGGELLVPVPEVAPTTLAGEFLWVRLPTAPAGTYAVELYIQFIG